jgi:hypothetical protein
MRKDWTETDYRKAIREGFWSESLGYDDWHALCDECNERYGTDY